MVGLAPRLVVRLEPLRSRPLPALAVRLLAVPLRPFRLPLVVPLRPLLLAVLRSLRLLPLRPLLVPFRLRLEPLLALRSFRLLLRSLRLAVPFRSFRLPLLARPFRVPEERSLAAVRVRAGVGLSSLLAAACSWSIRCPASLVQLCEGMPRPLSWRAKLLAAASFGKGPTSSRFGPV